MMTLVGSHGTTASKYENVKKFGWHTGKGRGGTAAYFWKKSNRYLELAKAWYTQSRTEGRYDGDTDARCRILIVEIECEEYEYYDTLGDSEFKDTIDRFATEKKLSYETTRQISTLMDLFIDELEKEEGVSYKVISMEVAPPSKNYINYPIVLLGAPVCYACKKCGSV